MRIAILYRQPCEEDQGFAADSDGRGEIDHIIKIEKILKKLNHEVALVKVNLDTYEYLKNKKFDLAFNLCDDGFHNNPLLEAHIPAMLDILGVPYTGAGHLSLAICVDKARTKKILSFEEILTPEFYVFKSCPEKLNGACKFPAIVKPLHEDASIGIKQESVVKNAAELKERIAHVISYYKQPALVERFIVGREIYIGILGNKDNLKVLPASEVIFDDKLAPTAQICSYEAKWVPESKQYNKTPVSCPANINKKLEKQLIDMAKQAFVLLGCQDYGRIDFRIDEDNRPYVLEVNPNPDISEEAGIARMASAAGINYEQLIEQVVKSAVLRQKPAKKKGQKAEDV